MSQPVYALGIDVGSTTVKTVVIDDNKQILSHCYQRHLSRVRETVAEQITALQQKFPEIHTFLTEAQRPHNYCCTACALQKTGRTLRDPRW